jgi:hypothetical protein
MMEHLFPVMFCGYFPDHVWNVLAELSFYFRKLCAKEINPNEMENMECDVFILICKLEKIFPPGFFVPMQHLILHLSYEARMTGPVQYRWSHPLERCQKRLKTKVKNRFCVEACIAEACVLEEISSFPSIYFPEHVNTVHNPIPRYNVDTQLDDCQLSLFSRRGDIHMSTFTHHSQLLR